MLLALLEPEFRVVHVFDVLAHVFQSQLVLRWLKPERLGTSAQRFLNLVVQCLFDLVTDLLCLRITYCDRTDRFLFVDGTS